MPPHNLTYTAIGAAMLWVGWFGFNAGSALAADGIAASAFAATHFCRGRRRAGLGRLEWIIRGKPTVLGACSGVVAGLVCITPAAGFVQPMPAIADGRGRRSGLLPGLHQAQDGSSATTTRWTPSACTASAERWGRS